LFVREALYHLSLSPNTFRVEYFQDEVSRTICLGWFPNVILLISASQIARITVMSYHSLAGPHFFLKALGLKIVTKLYHTLKKIIKGFNILFLANLLQRDAVKDWTGVFLHSQTAGSQFPEDLS
jgi:hypothetical protein